MLTLPAPDALSQLQVDLGTPLPPLNTLTSLTPLTHRISAIHASAFFHLFSEARQLELAQRLAALLRPEKGSIIFGQHGSRPEKGLRVEAARVLDNGKTVCMFCHSPESWREMWTREVFGKGQEVSGKGQEVRVEVDAELVEVKRMDLIGITTATEENRFWVLNWAVRVV